MATILLPIAFTAALQTGLTAAGVIAAGSTLTLSAGSYALLAGAGAVIDQAFLFPRLLGGREDTFGQRLQDLQIQELAEGAPRQRVYGKEARIAGTVVWLSDLVEVKDEQGGGKGGSGGEFITYKYYVSVAVQVCEGPVENIGKVWADGKLFYEDQTEIIEGSNAIAATALSWQLFGGTETTELKLSCATSAAELSRFKSGQYLRVSGFVGSSVPFSDGVTAGATAKNRKGDSNLTINSATGGSLSVDDTFVIDGHPTIYTLVSAQTVTASVDKDLPVRPNLTADLADGLAITVRRGASNNNGLWRVAASQRVSNQLAGAPWRQGDLEEVLRFRNPDEKDYPFVTKAAGDSISITQDVGAFKSSQVNAIRFVLGTEDQDADSLLVDAETSVAGSAAQVYAMLYRAVAYFDSLLITDFGNRLPSFEFLVEENTTEDRVSDVIKRICLGRLGEEQIDVSAIPDSKVYRGYSVRGPQAPKLTLQPILKAFNIIGRENGGVVEFLDRANLTEITVTSEELGAHGPDQDEASPMTMKDAPDRAIPYQVLARYVSAETMWQTAAKRATVSDPKTTEITQIDYRPLVLDDDVAQQAADRELALLQIVRREMSGRLGPEYAGKILEGDILKVSNVWSRDWRILLDRVERFPDMSIGWHGRKEQASALVQTGTAESANTPSATGGTQDGPWSRGVDVIWDLAELPKLGVADGASRLGVYFVAAAADDSKPWRGAAILYSFERATGYKLLRRITHEAVLGVVIEAPAAHDGEDEAWDDSARAVVRIFHPQVTLRSVSDDELSAGANTFLMGGELVQAKTARLIGIDRHLGMREYEIGPGMRRSVRGVRSEHRNRERCVWLDGPGVEYVPIPTAIIGRKVWVKVVSGGANVTDADPHEVVITGGWHEQSASTSFAEGDVTLLPAHDSRMQVVVNPFEHGVLVRPAPGESVDRGEIGKPRMLPAGARAIFVPDGQRNRTAVIGA